MTASWTQSRSRLATASKRIYREGRTAEAEREFSRAREDFAASRLEVAINRVISEGIALSPMHRRRLTALIRNTAVTTVPDGGGS